MAPRYVLHKHALSTKLHRSKCRGIADSEWRENMFESLFISMEIMTNNCTVGSDLYLTKIMFRLVTMTHTMYIITT